MAHACGHCLKSSSIFCLSIGEIFVVSRCAATSRYVLDRICGWLSQSRPDEMLPISRGISRWSIFMKNSSGAASITFRAQSGAILRMPRNFCAN
jgi:hypothetical protein